MKQNKYRAVKTKIDGYTFDSKAEGRRYEQLKLLLQSGAISELEIHPKYDLHMSDYETGEPVKVCTYIADFSYFEKTDGNKEDFVVEDVKGVKTSIYRLKKKMMKAEYGIDIRETK